MSNKVENNDLALNLDNISIEESEKIKSEMLRYRENRLSYILTLGALICSIIAAFIGLNSLAYNYSTIFKILMNIGILLFGFLFAEKAKAYSKPACVGLFVLGGISIARIAWAPFILFTGASYQGGDESSLAATCNNLFGQIIKNGEEGGLNWLPISATFRATFSMIFLIAAAALFISAAAYGIMKSQKLTTYLNSLKDDRDLGGKR